MVIFIELVQLPATRNVDKMAFVIRKGNANASRDGLGITVSSSRVTLGARIMVSAKMERVFVPWDGMQGIAP